MADADAAWWYYRLIVTGPSEILPDFIDAARGPGVTPWHSDWENIEEDVFNMAIQQPPERRGLDPAGCRILARQLVERARDRSARVGALMGQSRACPLDFHVLVPVPGHVLNQGHSHPDAQHWLEANWGVRDRPRQVVKLASPGPGRRLPAGDAVVGYGLFVQAGDHLGGALSALSGRWPALRFDLQRPSG